MRAPSRRVVQAGLARIDEEVRCFRHACDAREVRLNAFRQCEPIEEQIKGLVHACQAARHRSAKAKSSSLPQDYVISIANQAFESRLCRSDFFDLHRTIVHAGFVRQKAVGKPLSTFPYMYAPPTYCAFVGEEGLPPLSPTRSGATASAFTLAKGASTTSDFDAEGVGHFDEVGMTRGRADSVISLLTAGLHAVAKGRGKIEDGTIPLSTVQISAPAPVEGANAAAPSTPITTAGTEGARASSSIDGGDLSGLAVWDTGVQAWNMLTERGATDDGLLLLDALIDIVFELADAHITRTYRKSLERGGNSHIEHVKLDEYKDFVTRLVGACVRDPAEVAEEEAETAMLVAQAGERAELRRKLPTHDILAQARDLSEDPESPSTWPPTPARLMRSKSTNASFKKKIPLDASSAEPTSPKNRWRRAGLEVLKKAASGTAASETDSLQTNNPEVVPAAESPPRKMSPKNRWRRASAEVLKKKVASETPTDKAEIDHAVESQPRKRRSSLTVLSVDPGTFIKWPPADPDSDSESVSFNRSSSTGPRRGAYLLRAAGQAAFAFTRRRQSLVGEAVDQLMAEHQSSSQLQRAWPACVAYGRENLNKIRFLQVAVTSMCVPVVGEEDKPPTREALREAAKSEYATLCQIAKGKASTGPLTFGQIDGAMRQIPLGGDRGESYASMVFLQATLTRSVRHHPNSQIPNIPKYPPNPNHPDAYTCMPRASLVTSLGGLPIAGEPW